MIINEKNISKCIPIPGSLKKGDIGTITIKTIDPRKSWISVDGAFQKDENSPFIWIDGKCSMNSRGTTVDGYIIATYAKTTPYTSEKITGSFNPNTYEKDYVQFVKDNYEYLVNKVLNKIKK